MMFENVNYTEFISRKKYKISLRATKERSNDDTNFSLGIFLANFSAAVFVRYSQVSKATPREDTDAHACNSTCQSF